MELPEQFLKRMQERLGSEFPAFLRSYETPPQKGLRVNTLKISAEEFAKISPFALEPVPWEESGFYITEEKPGAAPYHFAGLYYLQEPSAMSAVPMLEVHPGERVLDLCAAPGGKTTQIAAKMGGEGILIANEVEYLRAKILAQNVERMGAKNVIVTYLPPKLLVKRFPAYFDKILVDAPCSGEGMFKKEENAIPEWSEGNIKRCAARQRDILDCAAEMLAGGGTLVYSTCTFSEEEDEWQIEDFLKRHPEFELIEMKKLLPHRIRGEGHFTAKLVKREGTRRDGKSLPKAKQKAVSLFLEELFGAELAAELTGNLYEAALGNMRFRYHALPDGATISSGLLQGVELGEWDGRVFKPAHALAISYGTQARRKVVLSREEARKYLRGETLEADIENGWCVVCVEEFPLGLGKAVNGLVKNHLPKGIRMVK